MIFEQRMRNALYTLIVLAAIASTLEMCANETRNLVLDSVGYNPGEKRFRTTLDNPRYESGVGFNGKVLDISDSPLLAIDWSDVDPRVFPRFSPGRKWVESKAKEIERRCADAKAAGLKVYAQCDMILLPKNLVRLYHLEKTLGNPKDITIESFIRLNIQRAMQRFPSIDGYILRIGETYTHSSPFHNGHLIDPMNVDNTIVPLISLLVEEICNKKGKELIVRTWVSFDEPANYEKVSHAILPNKLLYFSVKHCESDFHRGHPFSRIIGSGRHKQIIEIQCAREYEGKGAYPNYIAHGVIEGFEEHIRSMTPNMIRSIRDFSKKSSLFSGIWTWSQGGGWGGPYINNEFWPRINAWVLAQWSIDKNETEEQVFYRYCADELRLSSSDAKKFRQLCLKSADAVIRGKISLNASLTPGWTRDDTLNTPQIPMDAISRGKVLAEKAEAVELWKEMYKFAKDIKWTDVNLGIFVINSCEYGQRLYEIYQAVYELKSRENSKDREAIIYWLKAYDQSWAKLREICDRHDAPASSYQELGSPKGAYGEGVNVFIARMRRHTTL